MHAGQSLLLESWREGHQRVRNVLPLLFGQAQGRDGDSLLHIRCNRSHPMKFGMELGLFPGPGQKTWLSSAFGFAHFLPGFLVGVLVGLMVELPKGHKHKIAKEPTKEKKRAAEIRGGVRRGIKTSSAPRVGGAIPAIEGGGELKMVLVVRLDLKMGSGKIASQCALKFHNRDMSALSILEWLAGNKSHHAAVGTFEECLSRGQRYLLKKWEDCGQPKIVVTCNSQNEMNELRAKAERIGLPVYTVADAGRTQVAAGSHTVLAIGPGIKTNVDSVTRHLKLL